jgi:hypothetical protein
VDVPSLWAKVAGDVMKECEEKKDLEIHSDVNLEWPSDEKASYLAALGCLPERKIKGETLHALRSHTNTSTQLV